MQQAHCVYAVQVGQIYKFKNHILASHTLHNALTHTHTHTHKHTCTLHTEKNVSIQFSLQAATAVGRSEHANNENYTKTQYEKSLFLLHNKYSMNIVFIEKKGRRTCRAGCVNEYYPCICEFGLHLYGTHTCWYVAQ